MPYAVKVIRAGIDVLKKRNLPIQQVLLSVHQSRNPSLSKSLDLKK